MQACSEKVVEQAKEHFGLKKFAPRVYMIPDDSDINAYAFGRTCIGVNQAALQLDQGLLQAIISHEIGHILALDATVNRIVFVNLLVIVLGFLAGQYVILGCVLGVVLVLAFCGMFRSWFSFYLISGLLKGLKKICEGIGHILLAIYRAINCWVSRRREYIADRCACELGYATQLLYFLKRIEGNPRQTGTLVEALYDTHPLPQKRVIKIEEYERKKAELALRL